MTYATPGAFRIALERRLLNTSKATGMPLTRLRKLAAFERLLARLNLASSGHWILKGAIALQFRLGTNARTTQDMDLGCWDSEPETTDALITAGRLELDDHFRFDVDRTKRLDKLSDVFAVRYHVSAFLSGRKYEELIVDIGFTGPIALTPDQLPGPNLLAFAGIEAVEVPTIPIELHVAEKLHAYTRVYSDGRTSTRPKDLVDLVLVSSHLPFLAERLRTALRLTFDGRGIQALPPVLPPPPETWIDRYGRLAKEAAISQNMAQGYEHAQAFLDPVLGESVSPVARWDPAARAWIEP